MGTRENRVESIRVYCGFFFKKKISNFTFRIHYNTYKCNVIRDKYCLLLISSKPAVVLHVAVTCFKKLRHTHTHINAMFSCYTACGTNIRFKVYTFISCKTYLGF